MYNHTASIKTILHKKQIFDQNLNIDNYVLDKANLSNINVLTLGLIKDPTAHAINQIKHLHNAMGYHLHSVDSMLLSNNNFWSINWVKHFKIGLRNNVNIHVGFVPDRPYTLENRCELLGALRSVNIAKAKEYYKKISNYDFIIIFDTDLLAETIPVQPILQSLCIKNRWSCISGNICFRSTDIYFDMLALRFTEDPTDIRVKYPDFERFYGRSTNWIDRFLSIDTFHKVRAAFGGVSIYKAKEIFDLSNKYKYDLYYDKNMPPFTCEHIVLCDRLKNDILINPNIYYHNNFNLLQDNLYLTLF